jgi:hypothetical protein
MVTRSLVTSALAATLLTFSLVACSDGGSSAADEDIGDDALAESSESELKADSFLAKWTNDSAQAKDFTSLTLKAGGWYEASIAVCPPAPPGGVSCLAMPIEESGRFSVLKSGSKQTLRLVPKGAAVRRYGIAFAATIAVVGAPRAIELTRSGKSQVLNEAKSAGGVACGASQCAPGLVCCNPLSAICTKPGEFCAQ